MLPWRTSSPSSPWEVLGQAGICAERSAVAAVPGERPCRQTAARIKPPSTSRPVSAPTHSRSRKHWTTIAPPLFAVTLQPSTPTAHPDACVLASSGSQRSWRARRRLLRAQRAIPACKRNAPGKGGERSWPSLFGVCDTARTVWGFSATCGDRAFPDTDSVAPHIRVRSSAAPESRSPVPRSQCPASRQPPCWLGQ